MRKFTSTQADSSKTPFLGVTPIEDVWLDPNCRDEVTKILRGMQEIYRNKALLSRIEIILNSLFEDKSKDKGRQGMDLWVVFILGMLRVGCNWDFDRLKSCYDNHHKVREIAGVDLFCDAEMVTGRQTIHDNVSLLTPNVLSELNKSIVDFGHEHLFPSTKDLDTRCDSFVFLTNVHFPTDFNLLLDCLRKIINICALLAKDHKLSAWREHKSLWDKVRRCYNTLSKMRNSNSQKEQVKEKRRQEILTQVCHYITRAVLIVDKGVKFKKLLSDDHPDLNYYLENAQILINQIQRRVIQEEKIPQEEKIYSVFEPHTEWICKGKAGVRQELGVRVAIVEDQHGFILNHRVMKKEQDSEVAFVLAAESKALFPQMNSISFDKGFHSKNDKDGNNNRTNIENQLGIQAYLPVKGRRNKKDLERETSEEFKTARKQHPAVESAINALESHGLDRCPDKGEEHFDRYVSMAIVSSNVHRIGAIIMARELEIERKKRKTA